MKKLSVIAAAVILAGCNATMNSNNSSVIYKEGQVLARAEVAAGRIVGIQKATIESRNGVYQVVGGATGAVAGGAIGNSLSKNNNLMTGIGAIAGAAAGVVAANLLSKTDGYVLTVAMNLGGEMQIVQAADVEFRKGERVNVQRQGNTYRVLKAD